MEFAKSIPPGNDFEIGNLFIAVSPLSSSGLAER